MATMRPSLLNPNFARPWMPGRALPKKFSSCRVTRIMTGLPILRESRGAICACVDPAILLPNPPPQYSPMRTRSLGSMPTWRATVPSLRAVLCVERCT